jgi:flagellar basal-body rod protein FlgG
MNGAFYIGATGLRSQQTALEVAANNIANVNTPAFKRSQVRFADLMAAGPVRSELALFSPDAAALLSGVAARGTEQIFTQGDLRQTGEALDLAIDGDGFIELVDPAGRTLLWRGGRLNVNSDGVLAASNGMALKAMISIPVDASELSISGDGTVRVASGSGSVTTEVGQIGVVLARDLSGLEAMGDGLYRTQSDADLMTTRAGEDQAGLLKQGAIETSNVELSDEMVNLLVLQRAYGANAQVLQAGDQLMAIANSLRR